MLELLNIHHLRGKSSYFSDIFDAEDESGKKYIIKKNKYKSDEIQREFLEWIMQSPHPNLLAPIEIREGNHGRLTEIYKFVEWPLFGDLFPKVFPFEGNRKSLGFDKTLKIIEQITSALAYVHSYGCIHHDVRAGNMFFNPESLDVKIFDYNLVRKPYFLYKGINSWDDTPPEYRTGNTFIDPAYDVYRTGSMLFNMAYTFGSGRDKKKTLRSGIPLEALPIISKAYSDNKEERYRDCNEMLEAISTLGKSLEVF